MELIAAGKAIDYDGASGVTLVGAGESAGRYREFEVKGGKYETIKFRCSPFETDQDGPGLIPPGRRVAKHSPEPIRATARSREI